MRGFFRTVAAITIFVSVASACKSKAPNHPSGDPFIIRVDSLRVAKTIALGDTLTCRFWGVIGPDLCYQFLRFGVEEGADRIDLTLWGRHTGDAVCAMALSELRGREYHHVPVRRGTFRIFVHQPDGSALKDSVRVE